jgi:hypothetical protein
MRLDAGVPVLEMRVHASLLAALHGAREVASEHQPQFLLRAGALNPRREVIAKRAVKTLLKPRNEALHLGAISPRKFRGTAPCAHARSELISQRLPLRVVNRLDPLEPNGAPLLKATSQHAR